LQGFWVEDDSEGPRRSRPRRIRVDERISGLAEGHSCYAQSSASVLPALRVQPSLVPHTSALCASHRSSPPRVRGLHAAAPHAPGTKAAARPRWHRRRRPRTRRDHLAARRTCPGLQGFWWRSVSDLGSAACSEAELTKRSATSQLATAGTRSLQPPSCPLSERRRAGRPNVGIHRAPKAIQVDGSRPRRLSFHVFSALGSGFQVFFSFLHLYHKSFFFLLFGVCPDFFLKKDN
jgi:hypothetical protein